jgi:phosphate-selective porin OprO/OprP
MRTVPLALAAAAMLAASPLRAQDKPAGPPAPTADVPADKPAEKPAEKKSPPASASAEGFLIQSESGDYRLQVRGYVQLDGRFFPGDTGALAIDNFLLRRVRPIVQGTVAKYFDFNITPDFGGGTTVLQDAYLDVHYSPKARIRSWRRTPGG